MPRTLLGAPGRGASGSRRGKRIRKRLMQQPRECPNAAAAAGPPARMELATAMGSIVQVGFLP